jgi:hypothetical protein
LRGCRSGRPSLIWFFLARRHFASKTLGFGPWISLDFLGFSRPKLDLSMGCAGFSLENFTCCFCRRETAVDTASPRFGTSKGRIAHGGSLTQILIFCKRLPPARAVPSGRPYPKARALKSVTKNKIVGPPAPPTFLGQRATGCNASGFRSARVGYPSTAIRRSASASRDRSTWTIPSVPPNASP